MLRTASVKPYNSSKKLSGGNYQAMPYQEHVARGTGSSMKSSRNDVSIETSPASTFKQPESYNQYRKDTESTANLSNESPSNESAFATPKQVSGLSAQLMMSSTKTVSEQQAPKDQAALVPEGNTNLSIRDMFESTRSNEHYHQEEFFDDDEAPAEEVSSKADKWNPNVTPPTSLNGTPVGPQAMAGPPLESNTLLGAPAKMVGPASVTSVNDSSMSSYSSTSKPVLYSAIGSLEDPSSHSFKQQRWKSNAVQKYEFPSTQLLIPPKNLNKSKKNTGVSKKKKKSGMTELLGDADTPPSTKQESKVECADDTKNSSNQENSASENMDANQRTVRASNLRLPGQTKADIGEKKSVKIVAEAQVKKKPSKRPVEQFRPSSDAYTPRMGKKEIKYKPAQERTPVQQMSSGLGTLSRPNFRDALRRVAMILRQHIVKIERRFESQMTKVRRGESDSLFMQSMKDEFCDDRFATPTYRCTMVRVPMAWGGMVGALKKVQKKHEIPSENEIYEFAHRLFKTVQLSSECSIVCLIYIERLMEVAKVPLLASTWKPIVMCGLLLASKVWQDLSSWNIEFATVYPQYSLDAIHRLELKFLRMVKWDLYISSSLYAKYYFALRALVGKVDFRQRYNRMVGGVDSVQASEARKIEERSTLVKEEALLQLSRSM